MEEKRIYKIFYMGLPMRGWIGKDGKWVLQGCFAHFVKYLKVSEQGWMIIIYECSYIRVLFKFLRGDFAVKEDVREIPQPKFKFVLKLNLDYQFQTAFISIIFLLHTLLN